MFLWLDYTGWSEHGQLYFEEVLEIVAETVGKNIKHLASSAEQGIEMEWNF